MDKSLEEYIKENPNIVKNMRHKPVPTSARFGPPKAPAPVSQQWRLGRNGPRPLVKRLGRSGPLRPLIRASNNAGMPRLVRKYSRFPPHFRFPPHHPYAQKPSVFLRLGWNPAYVIARQRVRQARQRIWKGQHFPSRVPASFPMGRRPYYQMYRPNYYRRRPLWPWGRQRFPKRAFACPAFIPNDQAREEQINNQLIKDERRRVQEERLRNVQNDYFEEGAQMPQQGQHFNQQRNQPTLPDAASAAYYPIARDDYTSASVPPERAPSPEGSIISALAGMPGGAANGYAQRSGFRGTNQGQVVRQINPFAPQRPQAQNQGQQMHHNTAGNFFSAQSAAGQQGRQMNNPFAPQNQSMDTSEQQMPHPYMADFRPRPHTGGMPLNQRFPNGDGYINPQVNASMRA